VSGPDLRTEDLLSLVRRAAARFGERRFMTFGDGGSMSFADLARRVAGFRRHLASEIGVAPGERVALMLKNSLFYPVAWLGTVTAGAVAVPVNSRLGRSDAGYLLEHSGAVAVVVDGETQAVARSALADRRARVVVARTGDPMAEYSAPGDDRPALHAGMLANIQYTSGTTGFPKGCMLTHRYWQRIAAGSIDAVELTEADTLLTSQPHSYIDPQWQVIAALRSGAHLVLLDGFHPRSFMADVARFGVTVFYCLGVMPTLLLKQPPAAADRQHSLRGVFCSAIPVQHHARIEERWGVPWREAFGMTETGINLAVPAGEGAEAVGTACIGRPVAHNEAAVIDEHGRELPAGEIGELVVRGLGFMEGYYRDPDATAAFFRSGWAHTGDLASRDESGRYYYRGRRKEMIRRGGENISPVEIEAALTTHPDVVECAVTPVPDPDLGEEIKAYVVLTAGSASDAAALAAHMAGRLARFKVPRYWEFRPSLPHTVSERVAKHQLLDDAGDWRRNTVDVKGQG
jgi:carnitine-CoA ligase